jgi:hypothetical protein
LGLADFGIFGDPNALNQLATFLRCDVTVLEAYRAEAKERNLEGAGLLRWFTFELPKVALHDQHRASHRIGRKSFSRLE